jgi:hypothetical protein
VLLGVRPGRRSTDALTVYESTGHAVEDVAAARLVYHARVQKVSASSYRCSPTSAPDLISGPRRLLVAAGYLGRAGRFLLSDGDLASNRSPNRRRYPCRLVASKGSMPRRERHAIGHASSCSSSQAPEAFEPVRGSGLGRQVPRP